MYDINDIKNIHLELSSNCNASCPLCQRNFNGFKYNKGYEVTELTLEDIKKIFPSQFIQQLTTIDFNGNFGDFILARDGLEIVEYFRSQNERIHLNIHTNGSARNIEFWQNLAKYDPVIRFDLDGLADTHALYRIGTNFDTIIKNAQAFIQAGGKAIWKMIPFDHNNHQIEECKRLSQELGFKEFILFDQGRNKTPVYDRKGNYSYSIGGSPKHFNNVFDHIKYTEGNYKQDNFNLYSVTESIECIAVKKSSIYIAANGEVYPCCFLGFSPRTFGNIMGNSQIKNILEKYEVKNNAKYNSLTECISWFNHIEDSWKKATFDEGRLYKCNRVCGKTCVNNTST